MSQLSHPPQSHALDTNGSGLTYSNHRADDMSRVLLKPLDDLQSLLTGLLQSLVSQQHQQQRPIPPPIEAFIACDEALMSAVSLASSHQIRQRRIESLKSDILELDARWRNICRELEEGKLELRAMLNEADERLQTITDAKTASIPYPELLVYAQSLSAFTSAPPNMPDMTLAGQPPPPLFFPPFPNEEKMRRGRLNAEAPLGAVGETHSVGRPPTASPKGPDGSHAAHGANPYRHDHRPLQPLLELDLDLDLNPDL